jgi:hypothetical protein
VLEGRINTLDVVIDEGGLALVGVDRFLIRQSGTALHRSVDHFLRALAIAVQTIVAPAKAVTFCARPLFILDVDIFIIALGRWVS